MTVLGHITLLRSEKSAFQWGFRGFDRNGGSGTLAVDFRDMLTGAASSHSHVSYREGEYSSCHGQVIQLLEGGQTAGGEKGLDGRPNSWW